MGLVFKGIKIVLIRLELFKRKAIIFWYKTKGRFFCKRIHGSLMMLDICEPGISNDLLIDGTREDFVAKEFRKLLKSGMTVLDIGGNVGYYVLQEAKAVGAKGKVIAFEPVERNFTTLNKNIGLNNYKNIETINCAVGNKNGTTKFFLTKESNLGSLKDLSVGRHKKGTITVPIVSIDKFFKEKIRPDFIRMDIEGAEVQAFKGMTKTLLKTKNVGIFVEVHISALTKQEAISFYENLKECGFKRFQVLWNPPNHLCKLPGTYWNSSIPKCEKRLFYIDEILNNKDNLLTQGDYYIISIKNKAKK